MSEEDVWEEIDENMRKSTRNLKIACFLMIMMTVIIVLKKIIY